MNMSIIKSYTDIEQSKNLAKILPLESADMSYRPYREEGGVPDYQATLCPHRFASWIGIPCWSLAALLNYLKSKNKFPEIKELSDGRFKLTTFIWDGKDCIQVSIRDTIVDACYEMILKLHKLNLL